MKHKTYTIPGMLLFSILLMLLLIFGIHNTAQSSDEQDLQRIQSAISKAVITCYSIEGYYPKDYQYLKDNYGLYIDETRYQIHYDWIGNNIRPDIAVFVKGGK